jgi:hypothetical protein
MRPKPSAPDTFFETVSDLMFGTMAIMVMLMCVFMALNQPDNPAPPQAAAEPEPDLPDLAPLDMPQQGRLPEEQAVAALEQRLGVLQSEIRQARAQKEQIEQVTAQFRGLEGKEIRDVEMTVMIDVTGSMQREIDELRQSIALLAKAMPRIVKTFRMSVVAFRRDPQNRDVTRVFGMQTIHKIGTDGGNSLRALERFVAPISAEAGSAPFERAAAIALEQFSAADGFDGQQALFVIGDVGPFEDRYGDQSISAANLASATTIRNRVGEWASEGARRRAVWLYTGTDEINASAGAQREKFLRSREFFKAAAASLQQEDAYSESPGDMLPLLVLAALG